MTITPIKVETFTHTGVKEDGTFENQRGAIGTKAKVTFSAPRGGCGVTGCNCSPGQWVCFSTGRTDTGNVAVTTLWFNSRKELLKFGKENNLY